MPWNADFQGALTPDLQMQLEIAQMIHAALTRWYLFVRLLRMLRQATLQFWTVLDLHASLDAWGCRCTPRFQTCPSSEGAGGASHPTVFEN